MKMRRLLPTPAAAGLLMTGLFYCFKVCAATAGTDSSLCASPQFTCNNGGCVSGNSVCNGVDNCGDNSDEQQNCCTRSQFTCDNGRCESQDFVCDGFDDCGDNSDEKQDCDSVNVGLAVGLSLGVPFLVVCFGIVGGCLFYCSRKRRLLSTHAVATTPATGAAVTTTQSSHTLPSHHPCTPPAPYPPCPVLPIYTNSIQLTSMAYYPPQSQTVQQDAHLSFRAPPPSYDAATSHTSYTTESSAAAAAPEFYPPWSHPPPPEPHSRHPPTMSHPDAAPYPPRHESLSSPNPVASPHSPTALQRAPDRPSATPSSVSRQAGFLLS